MKITAISSQIKNPHKANIFVDGKYRFSLDIAQIVDLEIKKDLEIDEATLLKYEQEGQFSKLYMKTLDYALIRARSVKEVRDYLWRKTLITRRRSRRTGEVVEIPGFSSDIARRVLDMLIEKGYVDDRKFAEFWVENRFRNKGISQVRLRQELQKKGVSNDTIEFVLRSNVRTDSEELKKIISKKARRYPDIRQLKNYLVRHGFSYDDIQEALDSVMIDR